ncbi:Na+/H+ antiporter subunit E [Cystobacter fuscus]|uniref:Na+/H+ antiporter subunit E n=1 Tax=Cystobacter fuscus TaxID=43 RepID=UPI0037C10176
MSRLPRDERQPRWKTVLAWARQWLLFYGAWVLFVASLEAGELLVGVPVAALGATASQIVWEIRLARVVPRLRWLAEGWRLPIYMFTGTWEILVVLARHLFTRKKAESLLFAVPYESPGDEEHATLIQALAIGYTTMTPNFVVVDIDLERKLLIYHQISKTDVLEMTKKLGARA